MILARTEAELRTALHAVRESGGRVGLVPTRGALHGGQLSLIDRCRSSADSCVVSVWRDPRRFPTDADSASHAWDPESDCQLAAERGAHVVFVSGDTGLEDSPERWTFDPDERSVAPLAETGGGRLGGFLRETARLLDVVRPQLVVVGRKDLRRAVLVRRMMGELDADIAVDVAPIARAEDGLALSSVNEALSSDQRNEAVGVVRGLEFAREAYKAGERSAAALAGLIRDEVQRWPLLSIVRAEIVRVEDLSLHDPVEEGSAALLIARCGAVRLMDNMLLSSTA